MSEDINITTVTNLRTGDRHSQARLALPAALKAKGLAEDEFLAVGKQLQELEEKYMGLDRHVGDLIAMIDLLRREIAAYDDAESDT